MSGAATTLERPPASGPSAPVGAPAGFWTLANLFTFARFALAPVVAGFLLVQEHWAVWVGGWTAGFAMFTDFLDGYFARRSKQVSDLGKIFDPLADAVFFLVVWTALALTGAFPLWLVVPFLAREFLQHVYLRPEAARHGLVLAALFWGKLKTVMQIAVLIAVCFVEVGIDYWPWMAFGGRLLNTLLLGATALVSVLSIVPYFRLVHKARREAATP